VKSYNLNDNDKKILLQLTQNPEGLRVKSISKYTGIKQVTVYKRLNIIRNKKLIYNLYPIWKISNGQVEKCRELLSSDEIFELHNISYVVKLIRKPEWWGKRKNYLIRLKEWQFKEVNFGKNNSNPYIQLKNESFVVQCYQESLIIISRKRYYSNNPYETSIKALNDVLDLLDWICERFRFNFFVDGVPHLEVRNNDFNRLDDALANKIKKEKTKFLVEISKNKKVWVDMSEPFGKEANYPEAQEILEKVTKDYLLNKPMLNSELQMAIQGVTSNQLMFNQNFESHVSSIKQLGNSAEANSKTTELLADVVSSLMNQVKELNKTVKILKNEIQKKDKM